METETLDARPTPMLSDPDRWNATHDGAVARLTTYANQSNSSTAHLRLDELRAIVQQAYDRYGILAQPSYGTEAQGVRNPAQVIVDEWTTDPTDLLRQQMQRAQTTGVRA